MLRDLTNRPGASRHPALERRGFVFLSRNSIPFQVRGLCTAERWQEISQEYAFLGYSWKGNRRPNPHPDRPRQGPVGCEECLHAFSVRIWATFLPGVAPRLTPG